MSNTSTSATTPRSIIGPLTTAFQVPTSCSNLLQAQGDGNGAAYQAQKCSVSYYTQDGSAYYSDQIVDDPVCWPSATGTTPTPPLLSWGFYSPGLDCPSGWVTACSQVLLNDGSLAPITSGTSFTFQFDLLPDETAVGCCPSGYACFSDPSNHYQTCLSHTSSGTFPKITCTQGLQTTDSSFALPDTYSTSTSYDNDDSPVTTSTEVVDVVSLLAPLIQINWRSSDRLAAVTPAKPAPTPTPQPTSSPAGLSKGTKVAIGVVVPFVLLAAAAFLLHCLYQRRRKRTAVGAGDVRGMYTDGAELDATTPFTGYELGARDKPQELATLREDGGPQPGTVYELGGEETAEEHMREDEPLNNGAR